MADRAVYVTVHGRVQGVFFRSATRDRAASAGVDGWVRNRPDGTVEAWLEGPEDAVDRVLRWMEDGGPPRARVDRVEARDREPTRPAGFTIAR